ncbi:MAG: hypothetical protein V4556_07885 [Bacteroidota bacterium]
MKIIIISILFCLSASLFAQDKTAFCKAVKNEDFKKVERLLKKQLNKRKRGIIYYNGPGSGNQISHTENLDTLTMWLQSMPCVTAAAWDRCQNKIMIYPGFASIGAKFKTKKGIVEKCFFIQIGTTGNVNAFGGRMHVFKAKNILVYKKMYDCKGFVEEQKKLCLNETKSTNDHPSDTGRINPDRLIGQWQSSDTPQHTIEFINQSFYEVKLVADSFSTYTFFKDSFNTIPLSGVKIMWPPYGCYIKYINESEIIITYSDYTMRDLATIRYRRKLLKP